MFCSRCSASLPHCPTALILDRGVDRWSFDFARIGDRARVEHGYRAIGSAPSNRGDASFGFYLVLARALSLRAPECWIDARKSSLPPPPWQRVAVW